MAVPVRAELLTRVGAMEARRIGGVSRMIAEQGVRVEGFGCGLPKPVQLVDEARQRLDDWSDRLGNSLLVGLDRKANHLGHLAVADLAPCLGRVPVVALDGGVHQRGLVGGKVPGGADGRLVHAEHPRGGRSGRGTRSRVAHPTPRTDTTRIPTAAFNHTTAHTTKLIAA